MAVILISVFIWSEEINVRFHGGGRKEINFEGGKNTKNMEINDTEFYKPKIKKKAKIKI